MDFKAKKQMDKDQKEEDGAETQERGFDPSWVKELVEDKRCGSTHREGNSSFESHCGQSDSIKTEFLKRIHPSNTHLSSIQQKNLETCLFTLFKSQNLFFFSRGIFDQGATRLAKYTLQLRVQAQIKSLA